MMIEKIPDIHENQRQRVLIVVNPVSGIKDTSETLATIQSFCASSNWDFEIHETAPGEDLRSLVQSHTREKIDFVLAAGGDGTIAGVVCGLVNSQVPLGILPLGTGNLLARDLGIPLDLEGALQLITSQERVIQTMDVIQVGEAYYVLNVSIGVSADTMERTGRAEKRRFGLLAYLRRGFESINQARLHRFRAEIDGRKIAFRASEVMIVNEKLMGLQPQLDGVEVVSNDGALNMFVVRAHTFWDYLGVFQRFLFPASQKNDAQLKHLVIRDRISLQSDRHLRVQADGEVIGQTPVEICVIPAAIQVMIPRQK